MANEKTVVGRVALLALLVGGLLLLSSCGMIWIDQLDLERTEDHTEIDTDDISDPGNPSDMGIDTWADTDDLLIDTQLPVDTGAPVGP